MSSRRPQEDRHTDSLQNIRASNISTDLFKTMIIKEIQLNLLSTSQRADFQIQLSRPKSIGSNIRMGPLQNLTN